MIGKDSSQIIIVTLYGQTLFIIAYNSVWMMLSLGLCFALEKLQITLIVIPNFSLVLQPL